MDGNVRRLPPWMLAGASSSGVTGKGNQSDDKSVEVKRRHESEAPKSIPERRPRRTVRKPKDGDDSEEPKKVGTRKRGAGTIRDAKASHGEIGQKDLLTVDDLLSFAKEYVESEDQKTGDDDDDDDDDSESLSIADSSMRSSSQIGRVDVTGSRESTKLDMLNLLLGPFFKKP